MSDQLQCLACAADEFTFTELNAKPFSNKADDAVTFGFRVNDLATLRFSFKEDEISEK